MKIKIFYLTLLTATIISCVNTKKEDQTTEEIINQTPEVFDESSSSIGSWSKRYDQDIIAKLYKEALEKNADLKLLNSKIEDIRDISSDSTSAYYKYAQINNRYWNTVNSYIENINDSIVKQSTKTLFDTLQSNYKTSILKHENEIKNINKSRLVLEDQLILMKLAITQPMIKNFQKNELPNIKSLEKIIEDYNVLIEQTKQYDSIETE